MCKRARGDNGRRTMRAYCARSQPYLASYQLASLHLVSSFFPLLSSHHINVFGLCLAPHFFRCVVSNVNFDGRIEFIAFTKFATMRWMRMSVCAQPRFCSNRIPFFILQFLRHFSHAAIIFSETVRWVKIPAGHHSLVHSIYFYDIFLYCFSVQIFHRITSLATRAVTTATTAQNQKKK